MIDISFVIHHQSLPLTHCLLFPANQYYVNFYIVVFYRLVNEYIIWIDAKQLDEFNREVSFLRAIRHPNIVLFMGVTYSPYMIVTELLDTSLYKLVHDKKYHLSPVQCLYIARKIGIYYEYY